MQNIKLNCTKPNGPTDPDMGQNFTPEVECPDRLLSFKENGRIVTVDCNSTCSHHCNYDKTITRFTEFLENHKQWAHKVFGSGLRTNSIINHITKELKEIEETPTDLEEWCDVLLLAFNGAHRAGHTTFDILNTLYYKHNKNEKRRWPILKDDDCNNEVIEHIRD